MKKVLIITYYFPPSGGAGVQKVLKHIKYLPQFGWQPIVLTVENPEYQAIDESLLEQIPKEAIVYKSSIFEPYSIYRKFTGTEKGKAIDVNTVKKEGEKVSLKEKIAEWIRATFFIPDARIGWYFSAVKKGKEILKEHDIDIIYSSSPPYTPSLIAKKLHKVSGLPWLAGFRDPWTDYLSTPERWWLPSKIDKKMEYSVYKNANGVEYAWPGIKKDATSKYPALNESKFHYIPNGFDLDDYPELEYKKNEQFTVTYTGSLYGQRNPESFLKAIELLLEQEKIKAENIKLRFVGRFGDEIQRMFNKASFNDRIEIISYVPHSKSIEYLMTSELLLIIVDEPKKNWDNIPGKVFEYIGTKRPVLAITREDSSVAGVINETEAGKIAHHREIDKIADNFHYYYKQWEEGNITHKANEESIKKYDRKSEAKQLSELLNNISKGL